MTTVLRAEGLGKRYRRRWALSDCTLEIPAGHVTGLVGPNGAGKTTLLNLAVGLLAPTTGTIEVCGGRPAGTAAQLAKVGYVAQDTPTYSGLTVDEHLRLGAKLNPRWDDAAARSRIERLGLDPAQRAGKLSGGQRAQLALTLGLAKRPELLILDEPVSSLDPLARREFLRSSWRPSRGTSSASCCPRTSSPTWNASATTSSYWWTPWCGSKARSRRCSAASGWKTSSSPTWNGLPIPPPVAAVGIVLAITGPRLVDLARLGGSVFDRLTKTDQNLFFARELEAGTHRLVWNQSVTRTRWLATQLGITALAAAAAVGALTLAVSWWAEPIDGALSSTHGSLPSRMTPVTFAMRGIVPVGHAVFAVVLGVALGSVIRKSLPAMAVILAVFTFVQVAVPLWVRPHLVPPVERDVTLTLARLDGINALGPGAPLSLTANTGHPGGWILSNKTVDARGRSSPSRRAGSRLPSAANVVVAIAGAGADIDGEPRVVLHPAHRRGLPATDRLPAGRPLLATPVD